jgi:hypothetical protein
LGFQKIASEVGNRVRDPRIKLPSAHLIYRLPQKLGYIRRGREWPVSGVGGQDSGFSASFFTALYSSGFAFICQIGVMNVAVA